MAPPPPERTLHTWQRIVIYFALLIVGVTASIILDDHYHLGENRSIGLSLGPLFLLTASGWPWWLYDTVRRVRWFAIITNDTAMKVVLAIIGGALLLMGVGWLPS